MKRTKSRKKVLVADVADFYRLMLGELLKNHGYDVTTVADDGELKEAIKNERFGLIILDLSLANAPVAEYLEALQAAAGLENVPIIATAEFYLEDPELENLRTRGLISYVNKALPIEEILSHVNTLLYPKDKDLRKSPRAQVAVPVNYEHDGNRFASQTFNLSRDGMFVVTLASAPPKPNEKVRLKFWLPNSEEVINCTGLVIWSNNYGSRINELYPPGMGVMFCDLPAGHVEIINAFVRERLKTLFQ